VHERQKRILINKMLYISVSEEWKLGEKQGIDSYVFKLKNNNGIIVNGDIGKFATQLNEPKFPVFDIKLKDTLLKRTAYQIDLSTVHFSMFPKEDYDHGIFMKQYYIYDTINGIIAKLVQPKRIGDGKTGIYIPKLKDGNSLCMYTENADSLTHITLLKMFKTIRYK
jgi:hypothetical protein